MVQLVSFNQLVWGLGWVDCVNGYVILLHILLNQLHLAVIRSHIFYVCVSVKYYYLKVLRQILEPINNPNPCPHKIIWRRVSVRCLGVLVLEVLFWHQIILLHRNPTFLYEISKHPLKCYYYQWTFHLIHAAFEKVSKCPLIKFSGRRQQMHFQVILLL
jgi:hypothetical protein